MMENQEQESPKDPKAMLRSIQEKEKRLKEFRESADPGKHAVKIDELLGKIRKGYRVLITAHSDVLVNERRDLDGLLWKNCFYRPIEEFRKRLRLNASNLEAMEEEMRRTNVPLRSMDGSRSKDELHNEQRDLITFRDKLSAQRLFMARLDRDFSAFLTKGVIFYQSMITQLEQHVRQLRTDNAHEETVGCYIKCIQRSLLYTGDLARYKELYTDRRSGEKDFTEARRYYERAAALVPSSGNPHNQMAVIATYEAAEFLAVYHYSRSIMSQQPFAGGVENLALLFKKNAKSYAKLCEEKSRTASRGVKNDTNLSQSSFLTRFVRLHGLIFWWSTNMHREYANTFSVTQSTHSSGAWVPPANLTCADDDDLDAKIQPSLERFQELLRDVLDRLDQQLLSSNLSDPLLVRMIALSIFMVHFAVGKERNLLVSSLKDTQSSSLLDNSNSPHTKTESIALQFIYGIVIRLASRINSAMESKDKGKRGVMNKLLPALSIFSQWLTHHHHYASCTVETLFSNPGQTQSGDIVQSQGNDVQAPSMFTDDDESQMASLNSKEWEIKYYANRDCIRSEVRVRSAMRTALSSIKNILSDDLMNNPHKHDIGTAGGSKSEGNKGNKKAGVASTDLYVRQELVELRGFLPLSAVIENLFEGYLPLAKSVKPMNEAAARYYRELSILELLDKIDKPSTACPPIRGILNVDSGNMKKITPASGSPSKKQGKISSDTSVAAGHKNETDQSSKRVSVSRNEDVGQPSKRKQKREKKDLQQLNGIQSRKGPPAFAERKHEIEVPQQTEKNQNQKSAHPPEQAEEVVKDIEYRDISVGFDKQIESLLDEGEDKVVYQPLFSRKSAQDRKVDGRELIGLPVGDSDMNLVGFNFGSSPYLDVASNLFVNDSIVEIGTGSGIGSMSISNLVGESMLNSSVLGNVHSDLVSKSLPTNDLLGSMDGNLPGWLINPSSSPLAHDMSNTSQQESMLPINILGDEKIQTTSSFGSNHHNAFGSVPAIPISGHTDADFLSNGFGFSPGTEDSRRRSSNSKWKFAQDTPFMYSSGLHSAETQAVSRADDPLAGRSDDYGDFGIRADVGHAVPTPLMPPPPGLVGAQLQPHVIPFSANSPLPPPPGLLSQNPSLSNMNEER